MHLLTYNQGAAKAGMLGAESFDAALRASLSGCTDVTLEQLVATQSSLVQRAMARPWPPFASWDLDLHTQRWQAVESRKARAVIDARLRGGRIPDALLVNTQSVSFALHDVMRRVPTFLSLDVTTSTWNDMAIWRKRRRHSRALMRGAVRRESAAFREAALVLAWSQWAAAQVAEQEPRARVVAHHPGIDTATYRPAPRRLRERPRVLFIGGRFEAKGGHVLLEALGPHLAKDVDLDVVTGDDLPARPGMVTHRLRPADPQLLDLLQQSDLLCLPTRADASPWVLLEAMACGTAVLSSRIGAIPEMLDEGRAGVLCRHDDARELRQQVMTLVEDSTRRASLAAAGRERVEQCYDAGRRGPVLAAILRDAAESWQRHGRAA